MHNHKKTLFSIIIVIFLVVLLHYIGWLSPAERFIESILNFGSKKIYDWSLHITTDPTIKQEDEFYDEYKILKEKEASNSETLLKLRLLEEENINLRKILNYYNTNKYEHAEAAVIGKNIDPIGSTIIIDKGSNANLKIDNPVIVESGILIGKIIKVDKNMSVVRLINDSQSKIAATIINNEKSTGIIEGGYGISVKMTFIPENEKIEIGDLIISSGLELNMPYGLLIGTVESIEKEIYEPFKKAIVSTPKNIERISEVSVITQSNI
jgi:rod shape-determining protein MreC